MEYTLSPARQRRLAELRAKYRTPAPPPEKPLFYRARVTIELDFVYTFASQQQANYEAHAWLWKHMFGLTDELMERYRKEGLRNVTFVV